MKTAIVNSLRFRYILGLTTLAILVTVSYFTMQNIVSQQRNFSQLVNLASHQSGLVNRISYFTGLMVLTDDRGEFDMAKSQVGRTVNKIKANHQILLNGSKEEGIPFVINEKLERIYSDPEFGLNFSLNRFLRHAEGIYQSNIDELTTESIDYLYMTTFGPHVLEPMIESAVDEYRSISKSSILRIERFELIIWLVSLSVLILEVVLIFNPLVKKTKFAINSLEKSISDHSASEKRLLNAQRLASIGDWQLNLEDNLLEWTDEIYRILGVKRGTYLPSIHTAIMYVHPEDRKAVENMLIDTREHKTPHSIEHRIVRPDGSERIVYNQSVAHTNDDGHVHSLTGTIQDITERKQIQNELELYRNDLEKLVEDRTYALQVACEDAEKANNAKSQFLSSMSHELRTPLNAIIGFSEMIKDYSNEISDDEMKEYINRILKSGFHLLELINEVLDLARIDAGQNDINIESISATEIIDETINQIVSGIARKYHVNLIFQADDVEFFVFADSLRFKQVLINLLSNAVKYNIEGGSVTVKMKLNDFKLRIYVIDTGLGISEEDMSKLFEPFERLSHKNSNIEGTGIGLTVTKQLMEAMDGSIGVESTVGVGSTFWIDIPYDTGIKQVKNEINAAH
ncbi:MAG: ATP-binding protein [Gammaproteobacteria bacterium]|nr:ATP-binding protein [Gammaproteobacteria bacterium]